MPDADTATVTFPDGSTREIELDPLRTTLFGDTSQIGVYTVERGGTTERFAVNLMDLNESSIAPAAAIDFGRSRVTAEPGSVRQTREMWRWFVAGALAVLALEWHIYSRRAWL